MTLKETIDGLLGRTEARDSDVVVNELPRGYAARRTEVDARSRAIMSAQAAAETALHQELRDCAVRSREAIAALEAADRERARELAAELVLWIRGELAPLLSAWMREPTRQVAVAIGEVLAAASQREEIEAPCGNAMPRTLLVLGFTFADALIERHPALVVAFGGGFPHGVIEHLGAVGKVLGESPALFRELEGLEGRLAECAARERRVPDAQSRARYLIARDCDPAALAAFDAAQARMEDARARATLAMSPPNAVTL